MPKVGDIIVNPWVSAEYNGKLNPMYATVYLGHNTSVDYLNRKHNWGKGFWTRDGREWRVIGHVNVGFKDAITEAVWRELCFREEQLC